MTISKPVKKAQPKVNLSKVGSEWIAQMRDKAITASSYQAKVFDWFSNGTGNAVINAVAGSGKTTTLEMLTALLPPYSEALFCAFNKHIKTELKKRLPRNVIVKTIHGLGYSALKSYLGDFQIEQYKYSDLTSDAVSRYIIAIGGAPSTEYIEKLTNLVKQSVQYCQSNLVNPTDLDQFVALLERYSLDEPLDEIGIAAEAIADLVNGIFEKGIEIAKDLKIVDYNDMIWLPNIFKLTVEPFDYIFVDESQDLSKAQFEVVLSASHEHTRFLCVGDSNQAIYGFTGADAESYQNIIKRLNAKELHLNICYRCPSSHIELAQKYVPQLEAAPNAIVGVVNNIEDFNLNRYVKSGDLLLCRMTAPLIEICIDLIAMGKPATIKGKDIAKGLVSIINQISNISGFTYADFLNYCSVYYDRQVAKLSKKKNSEAKIELLNDQIKAIETIYQMSQCSGVSGLIASLERLFSDNQSLITLSTVHRAKGLEADRVFIVMPQYLPFKRKNQQPWEYQQELNLTYVALTRAKKELIFVEDTTLTNNIRSRYDY